MNYMALTDKYIQNSVLSLRSLLKKNTFLWLDRDIAIASLLTLIIMILGFFTGLLLFFKSENSTYLYFSLFWLFTIPITHAINSKLIDFIRVNTVKFQCGISSGESLKVIALASFMMGISFFAFSIYQLFYINSYEYFFLAINISSILIFSSFLFMNIELIGIHTSDDNSSGQDFLAVSIIILKIFTRMVNIVYKHILLSSALFIAYSLYLTIRISGDDIYSLPSYFFGSFDQIYVMYALFFPAFVLFYGGAGALAAEVIQTIIYRHPSISTPYNRSSEDDCPLHISEDSGSASFKIVKVHQALELYNAGLLDPDELCWKEGWEEWIRFGDVFE